MSDWTGDNNSVFKALGASNHADKDRVQNDFYATDPIAIKKLEAVFPVNVQVWEPACGMGHLSKALEDSGHFVVSTDKVYRGFGSEADFLKETVAPFENGFDIITNPPYKYAKEFVLHALNLVPDDGRVIMFLKTTFLEGKARKKEIYDVTPPDGSISSQRGLSVRLMEISRKQRSIALLLHTRGLYGISTIKKRLHK